MRNILALGGLGIVGFAGIGWSLGWYKVQTAPTPSGQHISIDLNTPKIKEDVGRGKEKLRDYLSNDDAAPSTVAPGAPRQNPPTSPVTPAGYQRVDEGNSGYFPSSNSPPPFSPAPPTGNTQFLPPPR